MMKQIFLATMIALAFWVKPSEANDAAIEAVITAQIEAFKADDFETAFTYASPKVKSIFRTPENFGLMVRQGYPMVWRPSDVAFGESLPHAGGIWQKVRVRDAVGTLYTLTYEMIEADGTWQINGVALLKAPGLSA